MSYEYLRRRYGHSKQASTIAAKAINDRYHHLGIAAYSLHPGIIKTNLQSHDTSLVGTITRAVMSIAPTSTAADGARTSLYCATSTKAADQGGSYFIPFGKLDHKADRWLNDPDAVTRLWELADNQLRKSGFEISL